jgi:hypothetical protein
MRARIIFRGLTLFVGEESTKGVEAGFNMRKLTAYLISDPKHASMPLHNHRPYWGLIGRDRGKATGRGRAQTKIQVPAVTTIQLKGYGEPTGVTVAQSFLDYVPCLSELHWATSPGIQNEFITRRVEILGGTIRARDFIAWDWHGNTPSEVAYMDTKFRGFGANEVVVDIAGDDLDLKYYRKNKYLSVTGAGVNEELWPRVKGAATDQDIDPNTVEILFTNLPARRRRAVPWGIHFQTLVDAAGYPPRLNKKGDREYQNKAQYKAFVAAAKRYDAYEWQSDVDAMGIGQPFPFFIDPTKNRLAKLAPVRRAAMPVNPTPVAGRKAGEGIPADNRGGKHGHQSMGHDPDNYLICPHGRE